MKKLLVTACILCLPAVALGDVIWDESIHGELSGFAASPTSLTFIVGDNTIIGAIGGGGAAQGGPGWDVYDFTIGAGQSLTAIIVDAYAPPGNTTGHNIFSWPADVFLGSTTIDPGDIGLNILPDHGLGASLGPAGYKVELREFGAAQTYQLTYVVVPEPASLALLALGGLFAARRR